MVSCFTSRKVFSTCKKDILPIDHVSNVVYLFSCVCNHSYVGRTSLRLQERMKQHIPPDVINCVVGAPNVQVRCGRGRPPKNPAVPTRSTTELNSSVSSRTRSKSAVTSSPVSSQMSSVQMGVDLTAAVLPNSKTDTAITAHLKQSRPCREHVCKNIQSHFSVLSKARHADHLKTVEAVYIALRQPELCVQKDRVNVSLLN